jgi:hypothetical protein
MNDANTLCHRRNQGSLALRMAASTFVIVGKDLADVYSSVPRRITEATVK